MANEKNSEIIKLLEDGVQAVFTSERYLEYLKFSSKFHNYSFNNALLIMLQNPNATYVAGFNDWKKKHNRYVKKGEKGLRIIAPVPYKINVDVPVYDNNNNPIIIDGKPLTEQKTVQKLNFKVVSVFDISQTDGEPIPELTTELKATVENYSDLFAAIQAYSEYPIEFVDIDDGAKGKCNFLDKKISINNGMSESQNIKTALHEVAHSNLHEPNLDDIDDNIILARHTKEVQAESVAFIVANHFGIDTSEYSFEYIAGWSKDKELSDLKESLDVIQKEANKMIKGIQEQYDIIIKGKTVEQVIDSAEQGVDKDMDGISDERDSSFSEIQPLPDIISQNEMFEYGYTSSTMLPISQAQAALFSEYVDKLPIYRLYPDNTEALVENRIEVNPFLGNIGMYGVERDDWNTVCKELFTVPHVKLQFTEQPNIRDNQLLTLNEADSLFYNCDLSASTYEDGHYDKTHYAVLYIDNGVAKVEVDRQDFGNGHGSLINHISTYNANLADYLNCHAQIDKLISLPEIDKNKINKIRTELNSINITDKEDYLNKIPAIYESILTETKAVKSLNKDLIRQANAVSLTDMGDIINRSFLKHVDVINELNLSAEAKEEALQHITSMYNEQLSFQTGAVNPYVSGVARIVNGSQEKSELVAQKQADINLYIQNLQNQSDKNNISDKHNRIVNTLHKADERGDKSVTIDGVTYYKGRKNWSTTPPKQDTAPKYSKEENDRITAEIKSSIPIQDYAQQIGFTVQKVGSYYTLKEHDSVRIDPRKNRFVQNSTGINGSIIDFVMHFENLDKATAIDKLAKSVNISTLPPAQVKPIKSTQPTEKKPLVLPKKSSTMKNVFAYLINTRKIDSTIVSQWVKNGNLYQDTHNNCVFVTYDNNGKPNFASQRGTNTNEPFRADVIGSNYDTCHFINNNAPNLIIGEAVIDIMSVQTILKSKGRDLKNYNYLSTNGTFKTHAVINALQSSNTDKVILATDNDEAGEKARNALRALISEFNSNIQIVDFVPQNEKDWNAELVANVLQEERQQDNKTSLSDKISECQHKADIQNQNISHNQNKAKDKKPDLSDLS